MYTQVTASQSSDSTGFFGWKATVAEPPTTTQAHAHQPLPGTLAQCAMSMAALSSCTVPPGDSRAVESLLPAPGVNPLDLLMGGSKAPPPGGSKAPPPAPDTSTALLVQLLKGTSLPALPGPPGEAPTDVARTLLERLARNERFVAALAEELCALGLVAKP